MNALLTRKSFINAVGAAVVGLAAGQILAAKRVEASCGPPPAPCEGYPACCDCHKAIEQEDPCCWYWMDRDSCTVNQCCDMYEQGDTNQPCICVKYVARLC
jgi:hypothetical protein